MSLADDMAWYLDHLDTLPARVHTKGVWSDVTGGARYGTPAWHRRFEEWLYRSERAIVVVTEDMPCLHVARAPGAVCPGCCTYDTDGNPVADTGVRSIPIERYRWPMRAAVSRVARKRVPYGYPGYGAVLWQLATTASVAQTCSVLAMGYPLMGDPRAAKRHVSIALRRVRETFGIHPPVRIQKSDAQLDAEAA